MEEDDDDLSLPPLDNGLLWHDEVASKRWSDKVKSLGRRVWSKVTTKVKEDPQGVYLYVFIACMVTIVVITGIVLTLKH